MAFMWPDPMDTPMIQRGWRSLLLEKLSAGDVQSSSHSFSGPFAHCSPSAEPAPGSVPGTVFSLYSLLGEGNGTPLQYSCLENPMDTGAWWATVHGVTKSRTWLSDFTFTFMHWRRKWQPTPVFLPGEAQGWGSLVGCRLWGRTESDTTEVT